MWPTAPSPFFQWEVGFANGAFAVAGLLAVVFDWGVGAMAAVVLGYAMYLLQAGLLNGRRYFSGESRTAGPSVGQLHRQRGARRHGRRDRVLGALGRRARAVLTRRRGPAAAAGPGRTKGAGRRGAPPLHSSSSLAPRVSR